MGSNVVDSAQPVGMMGGLTRHTRARSLTHARAIHPLGGENSQCRQKDLEACQPVVAVPLGKRGPPQIVVVALTCSVDSASHCPLLQRRRRAASI
jgi:hypothetical protein